MKLLLLGATGLVGGRILDQALGDARFEIVAAPVRRALPAQRKLAAPIVDFDDLPAAATWWRADAALCALGTTMRAAGSRNAFRRVDHGYVLAAARLAKAHGTPTFVLNSAAGASVASWFFYSRVKGEVERGLEALAFSSLTLVRPGLIGGERSEDRPAERAATLVLSTLGPILPRSWRINPADRIARAMLDAACEAQPGCRVVRSADLN